MSLQHGRGKLAGRSDDKAGANLARHLLADVRVVSVSSLQPHPSNPRRGDVELIKQSLAVNGQFKPLIVQRSTGYVLAGNHTLRAAQALGWETVSVCVIDVDDVVAKRILLVDNRASDVADYDLELLVAELQSLPDLLGSGYYQEDLQGLLAQTSDLAPIADDQVAPLPDEPISQPGELIRLGEHRLFCGDARDPSSFERLLGDEKVDLLCTDPPFGVGYQGKTAKRLTIDNDYADGLQELLRDVFRQCDRVLVAGAPVYVFHPSGPQSVSFSSAFLATGWRWRQGLVWVKDAFVLGHADYHHRHEAILYGNKPGTGRRGRGGAGWWGTNAESSVLEVARPRASRLHPTSKPPELLAMLLRNSSCRGQVVLDPFAGSGSLLVACEQLGRKARLIELSPGYCDVIAARFVQMTGVQPVREIL